MSLQPLMPFLALILVLSAGGFAWFAGQHEVAVTSAIANLFTLVVVFVALRTNRPLWEMPKDRIKGEAAPVAARRNARLIALVYAWGAAAMFAVYQLVGFRWQHGWQYGSGMALIAAAIFFYAHKLGDTASSLRTPRSLNSVLKLTVLHGAAAAAGLAFLFTSGKLKSAKGDWPANLIFLAGGIAVFMLSAIAVYTHMRMKRAVR